MKKQTCPICDYEIETAIEVATKAGTIVVCCEECAEKARAEDAAKKEGAR